MKKILKIITGILGIMLFYYIIFQNKDSFLSFVLGVTYIIGGYYYMYKHREEISTYFINKFKGTSKFKLALFLSIPLIILEETVNTNPHGLLISIIIIVMLFVEMLILLKLAKKFKAQSVKWPLTIFVILGTLWELTAGGLVGVIAYGPIFASFMVFIYSPISYAYIAVIPLHILTKK
jgi:hypothetical protein